MFHKPAKEDAVTADSADVGGAHGRRALSLKGGQEPVAGARQREPVAAP